MGRHVRLTTSRFESSKPMTKLLGIVVLLILSTGLTACSQETENGGQATNESPLPGTAHETTTGAPEPVAKGDAETTSPDAAWDYVALGDSLAAEVGARRGYVDRYAEYLRDDTGTRVELINLGVSGQTSPQLLRALRNDPSTRKALRGAEVVTYNIGINDLGQARASYEAGTCGGTQGERCLRVAVKEFEANWDAITEEILALRSPDETIIRTAGLGYTPQAGKTFEPYLKQTNRHIARSAARYDIPCAKVSLDDEGLGSDGLHPDDSGYQAIADQLEVSN
jgi:lysophospholipase L1-like esterase